MALIGEMQYLTIGGNTYSLPAGGGGTVTSVAVSNATNGGLSISGSPISSSGTITIGHSNVLSSAQTTQAVYPITIDKNGHISAYGTAVTIPVVPTNVSAFTNDAGYLTSYTETDPVFSVSAAAGITSTDISNWNKKSAIWSVSSGYNSDHGWWNLTVDRIALHNITNAPGSDATIGDINFPTGSSTYLTISNPISTQHSNRTLTLPTQTGTLALTSQIPTKVSDLTNDSGFITGYTETDPTVPSWAKASSKPSYNFSEIGSIPTSISGYGITDAYTKSEVDGLVSGVLHYKGTKTTVSALPSSGNTTGDVWHVTADGSEWAWDGTTWQELGTAIDLSGYVPTSRTINSKALTGNISLTASDVGALPNSTTIPSKTSDLTNDSGFITTETDPVFSASAAAGITSSDISNWNAKVSDDKTWNGVELDKTGTTQSSTSYIPARSNTSATTAYQLIATTEPYSYRVAKWDDSAYLYSTTPSANDNSTKVATTAFVNSAVPTKTSDLTNDSGFINSIKTINNQSLIGSGDITVSTTAAQIIRWTESA